MSQTTQPQPNFQIVGMYLKDTSFESSQPPSAYRNMAWQPAADVDLKTEHKKLEDNLYEVQLLCKLQVSLEKKMVFIVEMQQAGTFIIEGVEKDKLDHVLRAYCPSIIFPYLRHNVSEQVSKAGFPALYLSPVDFEAQYMASKQQEATASQKD